VARFDIYKPARKHARVAYFLDVQADALADVLNTRIVVPLIPVTKTLPSASRLHPEFQIDGKIYAAIVPELGSVPVTAIGPFVMSVAERHFEIVDALDFVFQGY